uniref:Lipoprotein n=1 Tax=Panagrellus redivivus TaxID=6233 RepID=A0A7E4VDK5_PANRE
MFNKTLVAIAGLCIFTITACSDENMHKFTLWIDMNHIGLKADFYGKEGSDECYNLPYYINDKATSINTRGGCVALYQHANCHGRKVIFKMDCSSDRCCPHNNFAACKFNDQASSYEMC